MNLNTYSNLTQTIKALQKRGFNKIFNFREGKLKCIQNNKTYSQQDLLIVEYHRFQRDKNHPESSIIFIVVSKDSERGYVISSEKNMASKKLLQFMDKVKVQPRQVNQTSSR
jgi:hypothetical protein